MRQWSRTADNKPWWERYELLLLCAPIVALVGWAMWAGAVRHNVFLAAEAPVLAVALACGVLCGLLGCTVSLLRTWFWLVIPADGASHLLKVFTVLAVVTAFFPGLTLCEQYVYLFPARTTTYVTDYELAKPGPSDVKGKACELGLRIRDPQRQGWIELCSSGAALKQQGYDESMARIRVQAEMNAAGVRILDTRFVY